MPLHKGSSRKVMSQNRNEMMESFENTGKIGNTRPHSKKPSCKRLLLPAAYAKSGKTNPIDQGSSENKAGACPKNLPFLKR